MNFWLKGNVTIPARPHTVGGLIGWARGVNRALTELRDRKIEGKVAKGKGGKSLNALQASYRYDDDTSSWKLKYKPGFVNSSSSAGSGNIMPKIDGVDIDDDPAPELTVEHADFIYLKIVATYADPASAAVTIEVATFPTSSATSTGYTGYFPLGQFSVSDDVGSLTQWDGGNLYVVAWGANVFFWSA